MMKNMILPIAFTALIASMTACSDEMDPVLTQRDWDGTATYFQSADEHGFSMYYKPQVGFVGDPMPFYDPVAKDFKVMYLQDYRPNPEATYHPIFGVATKDGATYESLGELIPCGGRDEQDASVQEVRFTIRLINSIIPSSPAINSNLLPTRMHR